MQTSKTTIWTPVGPLTVVANEQAVLRIDYGECEPRGGDHPLLDRLTEEIAAYFAGELCDFQTPVAPIGTPFQKRVWAALRQIPFGETRSYAAIAQAVGDSRAMRAVGLANGANPLSILAPCHRVIRSDGSLGGYAGGLDRKRWLLEHEAIVAGRSLLTA